MSHASVPVLTAHTLKERHRTIRDNHPDALNLRVHRAISWLHRAEQCDDDDGRFIFLWIAFNAAYAEETTLQEQITSKKAFRQFLTKLCMLDKEAHIAHLIWKEFSGPIRLLLDNKFLLEAFWQHHRGKLSSQNWQRQFAHDKAAAHRALASSDTPRLLAIVFNRLYVLRNQLIHGGATWNGSINRPQLTDCTRFLGKLVPILILLMMNNPNESWSEAVYPVVNQ